MKIQSWTLHWFPVTVLDSLKEKKSEPCEDGSGISKSYFVSFPLSFLYIRIYILLISKGYTILVGQLCTTEREIIKL